MTARIPDSNGWFEIAVNPLTRAGVFDYLGRSIQQGEPNKVYQVLRSPDELSDPEFLNSLRLMPLIDGHVMLGDPDKLEGVVSPEERPIHGVIGDKIWYDSTDDVVYGNLKVWSKSVGNDPRKRELSLGYRAKYEYAPGIYKGKPYQYVQINPRANHTAAVPDGRMGDEIAVLDAMTFDEKDCRMPDEPPKKNDKWRKVMFEKLTTIPGKKNKQGVIGRDVAVMDTDIATAENDSVTLEDALSVITELGPILSTVNEMADPDMDDDDMEDVLDASGKPVMDEAGKPKKQKKVVKPDDKTDTTDAAIAKVVATLDAAITKGVTAALAPVIERLGKLETSGITHKTVMTDIAARDALANDLSHHVGAFDHADMTTSDVAKYGVKKLEIPCVDGQEFTVIRAWLHGRKPPQPAFTMDRNDVKVTAGSSVDKFINPAA